MDANAMRYPPASRDHQLVSTGGGFTSEIPILHEGNMPIYGFLNIIIYIYNIMIPAIENY